MGSGGAVGAVGYSVYLPSFADADGDGWGDLAGVVDHLDHLEALGVDLVWVTPFYPSPRADGGYDVAEFCAVDPLFGDLDRFDDLVAAAHDRGLRVIIDLVANHTSVEHEWFHHARNSPDGAHRDYYIWADPAPDGGTPNNWVSYFGGPAWTLHEPSGQYYLHLFLAHQPDLNWRNPQVRAEFERIIRFWLERGVDGFRIDAAQCFVKDAALRSNPQCAPWSPDAPRAEQWDAFDHRHDVAQPETLDIFEQWQAICSGYGAMLIGETHVLDAEHFARLVPGRGLDVGFWFQPLYVDWDADQVRAALREPIDAVADPHRIGWVASSLDEVRAATRFGGGDLGRQRALALSTLLFCLPGVPFLYQGEELGLLQGVVPPERRADPVGADVTESRDGCRTPMPWCPGLAFGFSTAAETWLPDGGRNDADTAQAQRGIPGSWFERYRALIQLRRSTPDLRHGPLDWLDLGLGLGDIVGFQRGDLTVLANLGPEPIEVPVVGIIAFDTHDTPLRGAAGVTLLPAQAIVVRAVPATDPGS